METGMEEKTTVTKDIESKVLYANEGEELLAGGSRGKVVIDDGHIEKMEQFQTPESLYEELINRIHRYHPSADTSMVEKAYKMAYTMHKEQKRKSGEPYIIHPLCVAIILADMEMDKETIVGGLLHDVVEDTIMTKEELAAEFGDDVALLVDGVTKLSRIKFSGDKLDEQAENLRKMFLAMAKDIRVIMIKLADRLHNMRTLEHMTPAKQQEKARETIEIYAPIAQRLGISKIKVELDDLSLKYLEPEAYNNLVDLLNARKGEREKYVQSIVAEVGEHIEKAGIKAKIDGRVKHFFSIYKKMKNQNKTIDQIYDLFAVRIIVDTVKDCYACLGVIHEMYKPIPGRFKDYIAMPKDNMYQSLHTTLIGSTSLPFEIQIRTYDMHKTAEYGIAAHWKYKEASDGKKGDMQEEEKLAWLRQILEWQTENADNKEFMKLVKSDLDLFTDNVYCFTPTGDVKNLPAGSTPVDFAYSIHSGVGNKMIGARVNGKLVTINYELKNGDCIEILTSSTSRGPSRDWLNVVKSTQARNKISQWFKNEFKEENIAHGKELVSAYCKQHSIVLSDLLVPEAMQNAYTKYGFNDWDALMAAIGHGALREGQVVNKLVEFLGRDKKDNPTDEQVMVELAKKEDKAKILPKSHRTSGIIVDGLEGVAIRYMKCCNPLPGDSIIGFITRGKGVSIHRKDCVNIVKMPEADKERIVETSWAENREVAGSTYLVDVVIYANNRSGLLADVSKTLSEKNIDIQTVNTKTSKQGVATMSMSFLVHSREEFDHIVEKIKQIESVVDVDRNAAG